MTASSSSKPSSEHGNGVCCHPNQLAAPQSRVLSGQRNTLLSRRTTQCTSILRCLHEMLALELWRPFLASGHIHSLWEHAASYWYYSKLQVPLEVGRSSRSFHLGLQPVPGVALSSNVLQAVPAHHSKRRSVVASYMASRLGQRPHLQHMPHLQLPLGFRHVCCQFCRLMPAWTPSRLLELVMLLQEHIEPCCGVHRMRACRKCAIHEHIASRRPCSSSCSLLC